MSIVESLHTYPVKSCAPQRHERVPVNSRGLAGDRRYMLINNDGRFITGRQTPALVLIQAIAGAGTLLLRAPGMPDLTVTAPTATAAVVAVRIWQDDTVARAVSADADRWFSEYLDVPCRLVYQHDDDRRMARSPAGEPLTDHVSFADGYPQLLIGSASLEDLNKRLNVPVSMGRFRPNIVVTTTEPYVEDTWHKVRIGGCEFDVVKRCARCVFTTVDPLSGQRDASGEPLATLRRYRLDKAARGVMFGVNLIPRNVGEIATGMPVRPAATGPGAG